MAEDAREIAGLRVVEETATLAEYESIDALLDKQSGSGRFQLFGARRNPVDMERIAVGGSPIPDNVVEPGIYAKPCHLFRLRDAYLLPALGTIVSSGGEIMHSSYQEAKYRFGKLTDLPGAFAQGETASLRVPADCPVVDKAFATMPWGGIYNYGHFALDCLPAVAQFGGEADARGYDMLFPPLRQWHRDHIARITPAAIHEHGEDMVFCRDLIWSNIMDHHLHGLNASMQALRRQDRPPARPDGTRIWMSRGEERKRRYLRNEELEGALREMGFQIVRPEQLPVAEQVALFSGASIVAGFTGAAFANTLFCGTGCRVIEVQPRHMLGIWVRNIAAAMELDWAPYFCESDPAEIPRIIGGVERKDWGIEIKLDLDDFLAFVARNLPG